ncbi:putative NBD/HSP70 family sugar kinase [Catenulispora sp. EB89]|uniref:ROK family protein n=1 Tax=Catenulispora sp. EB89 TaxID=3156257 RepID=UPI0035123A71
MTTRSGDRSLLRRMNLLATLRCAGEVPKTIAAFAAATGLSRTAAEAVVLDLVERGWLLEDGQEGHPGAGRPARHYRVHAECGLLLGLDIGPHNIVVTVTDLLGQPLASVHRTVEPGAPAPERLDVVIGVAEQALAAAGKQSADVWIAGVGTPGIVHRGRVEQVMTGADFPDPDLAAQLRSRLGCPVLLENDCNLAAVAERWRGVARDVDNMVFVLSGNRTSAGLLLDGKLYRGHSGGAGEIGALSRLGWDEAPGHLAALRVDGKTPRREEVFALAAQGDPKAVAAVDAFSQGLAFGIAALALALDPEVVVIGGGIVRAGETLLTPLRRYVNDYTYTRISTIHVSSLGNQSVSLGAVRYALDAIDAFLERTVEVSASFPAPEAATFSDIDAPVLRRG